MTHLTLAKLVCQTNQKNKKCEKVDELRGQSCKLKGGGQAGAMIWFYCQHLTWVEDEVKPMIMIPANEVNSDAANAQRAKGLVVISNEEAVLEQTLIKVARAETGDLRILRASYALKGKSFKKDSTIFHELLVPPSACPNTFLR